MNDVHTWLHRKGISRQLNAVIPSDRYHCTADIDTRGPSWIGDRLWRYTLRHSRIGRRPDWNSFKIIRREHIGRWRYRWHVSYRRTA